MLADFCLRLAAGMAACLLLLSPGATARPGAGAASRSSTRFFRTHFLTRPGAGGAASLLWLCDVGGVAAAGAARRGGGRWRSLGSVSWSLERSPGGVTLIVLTALTLAAAVVSARVQRRIRRRQRSAGRRAVVGGAARRGD